jgi:prefoldin subunit 5
MSSGDEIKGVIAQISFAVQSAVGDGAAAVDSATEAIALLRNAHNSLNDSRVAALQQLGHIQDIHNQLYTIFGDSFAIEISDSITRIRMAREKINNYVNHLANRISEIEKLIHLLEHWLATELDSAAADFRFVAEQLTMYYNKL